MCSACQALYDAYESLAGQLGSAASQASSCSSEASSVSGSFSSVIIDGAPIDDGVVDGIVSTLSTVSSNLSTLVSQCNTRKGMVQSACPGPNHYTNSGN